MIGFLALGGMAAALLSPPKFQAKDQLTEEEEIASVVPDDPFYQCCFGKRAAGWKSWMFLRLRQGKFRGP